MRVLAADIGGTHARLAIATRGASGLELSSERTYRSGEFSSFEQVLSCFLAEAGRPIDRACLAVAGPVVGDVCRTTNIPWLIDARALERASGIATIVLVNDFYGAALGIPHLAPADLSALGGPDHPAPGLPCNIALLGAGTGLGEALLVAVEGGYHVVATEGGHSDFAPRNPLQTRLLSYLAARFGHVSYERIVSGSGLVNVYLFLRDEVGLRACEAVDGALGTKGDAAAAISGHADTDPICDEALEIFCAVYGAEAGNLALKVLAGGGVYLAGGIAPKILPRLAGPTFREAFLDKGRYRGLLETLPVRVVTSGKLGLLGAAHHAASLAMARD